MERYSFLFSFLLLSALCTSSQASAAKLNQTQANILGKLFKILQSDFSVPSGRLNNSINPNRCNWTGVTCISRASSEVVSKLSFSDLGIYSKNSSSKAAFFDHLCSLDTLQYLDLSGNGLSSLPDSFSNCTGLSGLKYLNLSNIKLERPISDFSKFGHLEILDLSFNYLRHINLDPLTPLESLNLSFNQLEDMVLPLSYGQENGSLKELVLSRYCFTGEIPYGIFKHVNLTLLDLSHNQLIGSIPEEFNYLTKLEILLLNENIFTESIPIGLTKYTKVLNLSYNYLTGELYADLLSAPTLESIDLTCNGLTGSIPVNLSRNLYRIRLGGNQLNGTIPTSIGELSHLSYLELDGNNLSGEISRNLVSCKNLTLLNLASNNFENELPPELGNLSNLVVIELQINKISGRIPNQISNLVNLNTLILSDNSLSGNTFPDFRFTEALKLEFAT